MTMASGAFGLTLADIFDATQLAFAPIADSLKMELVTDAYTPDFNIHDQEADITNEITGTGYVAGGSVVDTVTITISGGTWTFDHDNEPWTTATFSNVRGRVEYDDTLAGDPLWLATTFGSDYSVSAGTFTVQEAATGVLTIDFTP